MKHDYDRPVTEHDFRMSEFRDAKPEDYEFRADGKIVRKDRWQTGMHQIAELMGFDLREGYEISDVIARTRQLIVGARHVVETGHIDELEQAVADIKWD